MSVEAVQEISKRSPIRFDVVSVQPGSGFQVLIMTMLPGRRYIMQTLPITSWITKNLHLCEGDRLLSTAMIFDQELGVAQELDDFTASLGLDAEYIVLPPGVNELDEEELYNLKQTLWERHCVRVEESGKKRVKKLEAKTESSSEPKPGDPNDSTSF